MDIKAVIFDWGRTLHDPETDGLFDGVTEMLKSFSQRGYKLALVSLAKSQDPEMRRKVINASGIADYFTTILVGDEGKDDMYEAALLELGVSAEDVLVVDDRVVRGIAWASRRGAQSVWLRNGKFADELPTLETGAPTYIITSIPELHAVAK